MLLETDHNLDLGSFDASPDLVEAYLRSVGDALPIYGETGIVPPLYLAATALGKLLRKLSFPPGAIHSSQEVATLRPVATGSELRVSATMEKPRRRAGLEFITAVCTVEAGGEPALTSKSTVLVTSGGAAGAVGASKEEPREQPGKDIEVAQSSVPVISKEIFQERLTAYAKASGDDNPLHLDPVFAAGTQFGGIIAHGMLTLAFVSEMLAAAHGRDWLESGTLRAKFKGAAYIGDRLEARGDLLKELGPSRTYSIGVWDSASGKELISGIAGLELKR